MRENVCVGGAHLLNVCGKGREEWVRFFSGCKRASRQCNIGGEKDK